MVNILVKKPYFCGTTIRLAAEFKNLLGVTVDPDIVKVILYDIKKRKTDEIILTTANRESLGNWFYNLETNVTTPEHVIYEWYCEINGLKGIGRDIVQTIFVK